MHLKFYLLLIKKNRLFLLFYEYLIILKKTSYFNRKEIYRTVLPTHNWSLDCIPL